MILRFFAIAYIIGVLVREPDPPCWTYVCWDSGECVWIDLCDYSKEVTEL